MTSNNKIVANAVATVIVKNAADDCTTEFLAASKSIKVLAEKASRTQNKKMFETAVKVMHSLYGMKPVWKFGAM